MSEAHNDLSYAGHAAATARLLEADPAWNWEPVTVHPQTGAPLATDGLFWIKLTVAGVTRLGVGDGSTKRGGNPADGMKEMIGDAIRNAAMRFGFALELWHKGDLHADATDADIEQHRAAAPAPAAQPAPAAAAPAAVTVDSAEKVDEIVGLLMNSTSAADVRVAYKRAGEIGLTGSEMIEWDGGPMTIGDALTKHGAFLKQLEDNAAAPVTDEPPF
jgi:hypothetical protein